MAETADFPQVTPSSLCNDLLELVRQVRDGEAEPGTLRQEARERLEELKALREATVARIEAQGPEHLQTHAESIAAIQSSFRDMDFALNEALRYAETRQPAVFQCAVEALFKAGYSSQASFDAYQRSELAHGPTDVPLLNLIHRLCDGHFAEGKVSRENLDQGIQGALRMTLAAAREMRTSEPANDQKEALARAYEHLAGVLEKVAAAVDSGVDAVREALHEAAMSARGVRTAMEALVYRESTAGPTRMAHANLVLKMAEMHYRGALPTDTLARGLEVFRASQRDLLAEIEAMASIPSGSDGVTRQMEPTRKAFEAHWEALALFEGYLTGEPAQYEPARQALIQAAEALADCQEAFESIGERANKLPCVRCGALNEPGNRSCSACGAQLLMPAGMGASSTTMSFQEDGGEAQIGGELVMTDNLLRLFEAVNAVAEGRIDVEDFDDVLDWFENLVSDNLLQLPAAPELSREGLNREQVAQLVQVEAQISASRDDIVVGGQELLAALEEMRQFTQDSETVHLVEGVRLVRDASVKVQSAQRLIEQLVEANTPTE